MQTHSDAVSDVEWVISVDTTIVRAHQHAAGARKEPSQAAKRGTRASREPPSLGGSSCSFLTFLVPNGYLLPNIKKVWNTSDKTGSMFRWVT